MSKLLQVAIEIAQDMQLTTALREMEALTLPEMIKLSLMADQKYTITEGRGQIIKD